MIKKIMTLFVIGRKLALSDALNIVSKVYEIPILIRIFFNLLGLFGKKTVNQNQNEYFYIPKLPPPVLESIS